MVFLLNQIFTDNLRVMKKNISDRVDFRHVLHNSGKKCLVSRTAAGRELLDVKFLIEE